MKNLSGVTVTVTVAELEQLRDRLGSFASLTHPDLSRFRVTACAGRVEWTATDSYRLGRLPACTADGDARVGVNPGFLFDLASAAGEDVITLHLPPDPATPLRVETGDGLLALLMPVRTGIESARQAFEAMPAELLDVDPDPSSGTATATTRCPCPATTS